MLDYDDYKKALRIAKREVAQKTADKENPYLPSLDEILEKGNVTIIREEKLGLVQIPMERIAGTRHAGRQNAFASNFMPLHEMGTEFAVKWCQLCSAHLEEGIHDPILAYEYMNRFYVEEGNKRVSVLRYFGADSVPGIVIRLIPKKTEDRENRIYYEFMDFYRVSLVNLIWFSREGRFSRLLEEMKMAPDQIWTDMDRELFVSVYYRFKRCYDQMGGNRLPITTGDALLTYISIFGYEEVSKRLPSHIPEDLRKIWKEFVILKDEQPLELVLDPVKTENNNLINNVVKMMTPQPRMKVGFIHVKDGDTSSWTYLHELGKAHLEEVMADKIEVESYYQATAENAEELLEKAIKSGCSMIFTTSPLLAAASLKAAVEHGTKIFNCSLNISHSYIRTYYARLYEAKFLIGAIAGAMTENNKVGYIADYPIYGMLANVNAFALGVAMTNPVAKVYLEWSTVNDANPQESFLKNEITYISGRDMITPNSVSREYGLYHLTENGREAVATAVYDWGKLYEILVKNVLSGSFKKDEIIDGKQALNYWWGLSAGVVSVIYSSHLPKGLEKLVNLLKWDISEGRMEPFSGELLDQYGHNRQSEDGRLSPEEIMTMDWLCSNIVGSVPGMHELKEEAKVIVALQGEDVVKP